MFWFFIGMVTSLFSLSLAVLLIIGVYRKRQTPIQSWLVITGMILSKDYYFVYQTKLFILFITGIGSIGYAVISILELLDTFAKGPDTFKAICLLTPILVLCMSTFKYFDILQKIPI